MQLNKYQTIIEQTAIYPVSVEDFGLAYAFIGFVDECLELGEKLKENYPKEDINKEKGDVMWYLTLMSNKLNISIESTLGKVLELSYSDRDALRSELSSQINQGKMPGFIKKYYRDSKAIDTEYFEKFLTLQFLELFKGDSKKEIEDILHTNYDKLITRRQNNTIHGDGDNR